MADGLTDAEFDDLRSVGGVGPDDLARLTPEQQARLTPGDMSPELQRQRREYWSGDEIEFVPVALDDLPPAVRARLDALPPVS